MKKYKPKSLFSGAVVGQDINKRYCAVPNKYDGHVIEVEYLAQTMIINNWREAEAFRKFEDKFGRKEGYTLGYFQWKPEGTEVPERSESWQEQDLVENVQQKLI